MPSVSQLVDLFRALSANDTAPARQLAEKMCRDLEGRGNRTAARKLRDSLRETPPTLTSVPAVEIAPPIVVPLKDFAPGLAGVEMTHDLRAGLKELVDEWQRRALLQAKDIPRRSKLLLHGPPGCGKSLTARALARELSLPIYLVRFDSIVGSYLGQTAINLRQLFNFVSSQTCVLLIDEVDAVGKVRGNPRDVGELDRIVIALMQELEHAVPRGLIVATTNLEKHLDAALWRRFDASLRFRRPSRAGLIRFAKKIGNRYGVRMTKALKLRVSRSGSFAVAEQAVQDAARRSILRGAKS